MISPLPGATTLKPGQRDVPAARASAPSIVDDAGKPVGIPGGGYLALDAAVAVDAARHLGRSRALPRDVLEPLRRPVLRGRRRQARRRRLLLAARPGRRRHARVGPPHLDDRGRVRARRPSRGRRGRGRRRARTTTTGQAIVAFVILRGGNEPSDDARRGAARPRRQAHRPDRQAEDDPLHRGAAEDRGRARSCAGCCATSPRTRRSATRRRSPTRPSSTASRRATSPTAADRGRARCSRAYLPEHWTWRDGPVEPGRGGRRRHRRRAVRRVEPPALPRVAAPATGARSSTRAATTRSSRRCTRCSTCLDPDAADRAAHRPAAPGAPPHRGVAAPLRDPLGPADHAAVGRLRAAPATSSSRRSGSCARPASTCGWPSRTTAATSTMFRSEGIPCLYVHSGYYD